VKFDSEQFLTSDAALVGIAALPNTQCTSTREHLPQPAREFASSLFLRSLDRCDMPVRHGALRTRNRVPRAGAEYHLLSPSPTLQGFV